MPKVQCVSLGELDAAAMKFWSDTHRSDPQFDSPYFHPEFAAAVAAVRDDVEIIVVRSGAGDIEGLVPVQRLSAAAAAPLGGRMNDYHGIMLRAGCAISPEFLLEQVGLSKLGFHALSANTSEFKKWSFERLSNFYVDLSAGLDAYNDWLVANSRTIARLPQKVRALHRDHKQVEFIYESRNEGFLEKLIELKQQKYQRTNTFDILSVDWAANLLREIFHRQVPGFRPILSVVKSQDRLVAAHFGMIAGDVLHYWFPVYDPAFSKYSPGLYLMQQTCQFAARQGIQRIDLTYGESEFKSKFANGTDDVLFGSVDRNPLRWAVARQRYLLRQKSKQIPMKENLKFLLRKVFPGYGHWHYR